MPQSEADVLGNADLMVQYVIPKLTDHKDVLSLQRTNKELRNSTHDNSVWLKFLRKHYDLSLRPETCSFPLQRLYRKLCTTSLKYPVRFVGAATNAGIDNNDGIYWVDHMFCPNHWGGHCSKKLKYTTCVGILQVERVNGDKDEFQHRSLMIERLRWQWVPGPYAAPLQTILDMAGRRLSWLATHWLDRTFHDLYTQFAEGMPDGRVLLMHADQLSRSRNLPDAEHHEFMKRETALLTRINARVVQNQKARYARYVEGFEKDGMEIYDTRALSLLKNAKAAAQIAIIKRIQVSREGEFSCPVRVGAIMMGIHGAGNVTKEGLLGVQNHPGPSALDGVTTYKQILDKVENGELPPVVHHAVEQHVEWVEFAPSDADDDGNSPQSSALATEDLWISRPLRPVLWFRFLSQADIEAAAAVALASDDDMSLMSGDSDDELAEGEEGVEFMDDSDDEGMGMLELESVDGSESDEQGPGGEDDEMEAAVMNDSDGEGGAEAAPAQHPYAQMLANNHVIFVQQFAHMLDHLQQNNGPQAAAPGAPLQPDALPQHEQPSTSAPDYGTTNLHQPNHNPTASNSSLPGSSNLHQSHQLASSTPMYSTHPVTGGGPNLTQQVPVGLGSTSLPAAGSHAATDAMAVSPVPVPATAMLTSPGPSGLPPVASHPINSTSSSSGGSSPQIEATVPHGRGAGGGGHTATSSQEGSDRVNAVNAASTSSEPGSAQESHASIVGRIRQLNANSDAGLRGAAPQMQGSNPSQRTADGQQPRVRKPRPTLDSPRVPPAPPPPANHHANNSLTAQHQPTTDPSSTPAPNTATASTSGTHMNGSHTQTVPPGDNGVNVIRLPNGQTVVNIHGQQVPLQDYSVSAPTPMLRQVPAQHPNNRYQPNGVASGSGAAHNGHAAGALVSVGRSENEESVRGGREGQPSEVDRAGASGSGNGSEMDAEQGELAGLPPLERARASWRSAGGGGSGGAAQSSGQPGGGELQRQEDKGKAEMNADGDRHQPAVVHDNLPEVEVIPAPDPELYRRQRKPESTLSVELKMPRATNLVTVQLIDCENRMVQFDDNHEYPNVDINWVAFLGFALQFPPGTQLC